jgi:hypothetical protein
MHTWVAEFRNLSFLNAKGIPLTPGEVGSVNLAIRIDREMTKDPNLDLFSVNTGTQGPNLIEILAQTHSTILGALSKVVGLIDGGRTLTQHITSSAEIDLSGTEYRQLRLPSAIVRLDRIQFKFSLLS